MNIHILNDHMDTDLATIWIKIGSTKKTSVIIGGLYREHSQLGVDISQITSQEKLKITRETLGQNPSQVEDSR